MSDTEVKKESSKKQTLFKVVISQVFSPRSKWLRHYYFKGLEKKWKNELKPNKGLK
ncbi:MAG: hypothetical protein GF329_03780 [Candidatus Lokiarchaeota archaeon]|nr:hypothetical protein [Candidatus Lokiarchaeota archaeon]